MPLLALDGVSRSFHRRGVTVQAVDQVSLSVDRGEVLGLIGESGSGKSTIARLALGLIQPDAGSVAFDGLELAKLSPRALRALRERMQIVFQEPYESLNPRMSIGDIVEEPLRIHRPNLSSSQARVQVAEMLEQVGLSPALMPRRPRDLSGGQQQRVGIARAVVTRPDLVVLDEPTSSLDLSVRARILTLLADLGRSLGLTYLFISHDISTVRHFCSRVAVMYHGRIVEEGTSTDVLERASHPYTASLLSAELSVNPLERSDYVPLRPGRSSAFVPAGICPLVGRCPVEMETCAVTAVPVVQLSPAHSVSCHKVAADSAAERHPVRPLNNARHG